jgi:hypothetical protein
MGNTSVEKGGSLIPLGRDPVYDASVRAKLKGSKSERRRDAQKLRRLKEMTPEQLRARSMEILSSPKHFDLEILYLIQELLQKEDLDDRTKIDLLKSITGAKNAIYGTTSNNKNLNVNVDFAKEVIDKIKEAKQQEADDNNI